MEDFPKTVGIKGREITLRLMTPDDGALMMEFAQQLPYHDLLFLRRDITKQAGIDKWVRDLESGTIHSVIAEDDRHVLGYSTLHRNDFEWSSTSPWRGGSPTGIPGMQPGPRRCTAKRRAPTASTAGQFNVPRGPVCCAS